MTTPVIGPTPEPELPSSAQVPRDDTGTAGLPPGAEREFTVKARTQRQLVTRRFFRHRGAMTALVVLILVTLLAFTSIGFGPFPGWWGLTYYRTNPMLNGGSPTIDLIPWLDGDGLAWGAHPFGQDNVGRDYFALTMRGTQRSLTIAFIVGIVATLIGVTVGAVSGYLKGATDTFLMRLTDVVISVPVLLLASVIGRAYGDLGATVLALFLGAVVWVAMARLVRGEFLSLREKEFVEAARALGASSPRIIVRHILPNSIGTIIVNATLTISAAILLETALSFLGFGVLPPDTSLGLLVSTYQSAFSTRPWLFWWPGIFIILIALSVNFIGDGLRDAFDPKQTRVRA